MPCVLERGRDPAASWGYEQVNGAGKSRCVARSTRRKTAAYDHYAESPVNGAWKPRNYQLHTPSLKPRRFFLDLHFASPYHHKKAVRP
jgi:hypothetical protein